MRKVADQVRGTDRQNPFSDSQARSFSDGKVIGEFCPVSNFWTLFNDQHEILIGTRGSGKTFLLKMMRYSMLKRIKDPQAMDIAKQKKYIALYIPMYLEFVTQLNNPNTSDEEKISHFQFAFNCLLAQSLITEITEMVSEENDFLKRAKTNIELAKHLNRIWFDDESNDISDLLSLVIKLKTMFYQYDFQNHNNNTVPTIFKRRIGASLLSVKDLVAQILGLSDEPTWIICIDEAEFLTENLQRCINSVFRSDSNRVALKVATLPFKHLTLKTLEPNVSISAGNDFNYRVVDLKYNSRDFVNLTNTLCAHRIISRFNSDMEITSLEEFVGVYGNDDQIDYYRYEVGDENATYETIMYEIKREFSAQRRVGSKTYSNPRKTIYDKFAPIFFTRRMYKISNYGNSKPGWYAGSQMIRKISQGNPRIFIQIMNELFEKARNSELTPKAQHGVIFSFVNSFCESTQALEAYGPSVYKELDKIASILNMNVHDGDLVTIGCNFMLKFDDYESFEYAKNWLQLAIAYSRLCVDDDTIINGIRENTEYLLANTYAAKYWLPMRTDSSAKKIMVTDKQVVSYPVKTGCNSQDDSRQLTFLKEE